MVALASRATFGHIQPHSATLAALLRSPKVQQLPRFDLVLSDVINQTTRLLRASVRRSRSENTLGTKRVNWKRVNWKQVNWKQVNWCGAFVCSRRGAPAHTINGTSFVSSGEITVALSAHNTAARWHESNSRAMRDGECVISAREAIINCINYGL